MGASARRGAEAGRRRRAGAGAGAGMGGGAGEGAPVWRRRDAGAGVPEEAPALRGGTEWEAARGLLVEALSAVTADGTCEPEAAEVILERAFGWGGRPSVTGAKTGGRSSNHARKPCGAPWSSFPPSMAWMGAASDKSS